MNNNYKKSCNKTRKNIIYYLGILLNYIAITLGLLFLSIQIRAFDINYYKSQFIKNNTVTYTGKSLEELVEIADSLIKYLIFGDEKLLTNYFSYKEVLHMIDVYHLFKTMFIAEIIILLTIVTFYIYFRRNGLLEKVFKTIRNSIFVTYAIVLLVVLLFLTVDFTQAFIIFHEVFFSNELWILNPETDLMIQMLPEQFFSRMALEIFILWIILNILLQIYFTIRLKIMKK